MNANTLLRQERHWPFLFGTVGPYYREMKKEMTHRRITPRADGSVYGCLPYTAYFHIYFDTLFVLGSA